MPEQERSEFATPIPLRDKPNGLPEGERPNPWSRLEAVGAIQRRLRRLRHLLVQAADPPDPAALADALDELEAQLGRALNGDLEAVTALRHTIGDGQLVADWRADIWSGGGSAG